MKKLRETIRELIWAAEDAVDAACEWTETTARTSGKVAATIGEVFWDLSPRLKVGVLAALLGVPMSFNALTWTSYKTTKQAVDCYNGLQYNVGEAASIGTPRQQLDAIQTAGDRFFACRESIDPRIGNIAFIKQQHERWRSERS